MSHKCNLSTQTAKIWLVIRKNESIDVNKIESYLRCVANEYAFIEHKCDIDPITGTFIGVHYHIWYNAKKKSQQLVKILNDWCDYLGFDNNNGVEIEKYSSTELCIQYLIHKNNPEKTQHKIDEIITNLDKDLLNTYLTCDVSSITFDFVYSLCLSSNNILEVIKSIGISNYQRYRATIWDLWNELHKPVNKLTGEQPFHGRIS